MKEIIKGKVAKNANEFGCGLFVAKQIEKATSKNYNVPKNVLIIGGTSGYGLSARIAAAVKGANTISVGFERPATEDKTATAGWYCDKAFMNSFGELSHSSIIADAFSVETKKLVLKEIQEKFNGHVDLIVYSLASGVRPKKVYLPNENPLWRSCIKPIKHPTKGFTLNIEEGELELEVLEKASLEEIDNTVKVMGGEDWEDWVRFLHNEGVVSNKTKSVAFSYVGPEIVKDLYSEGTLGAAKLHLKYTAEKLSQYNLADCKVVVCKALVTKASAFIPGFASYIMALYKVMKEKGLHEVCIDQMTRMFEQNYPDHLDDLELLTEVQKEVKNLLDKTTPDNFKDVLDYKGFMKEFSNQSGFGYKKGE